MARVIRSPRAKRDLVEALQYTRERWGVEQARAYATLIEAALAAIAGDPHRGKPRDDVRPGIRAIHIRQPLAAAGTHQVPDWVRAKGEAPVVARLLASGKVEVAWVVE